MILLRNIEIIVASLKLIGVTYRHFLKGKFSIEVTVLWKVKRMAVRKTQKKWVTLQTSEL